MYRSLELVGFCQRNEFKFLNKHLSILFWVYFLPLQQQLEFLL